LQGQINEEEGTDPVSSYQRLIMEMEVTEDKPKAPFIAYCDTAKVNRSSTKKHLFTMSDEK